MDTPNELSGCVPKFDILFLDVKATSPETLTKTSHLFGRLMTVLQKEHASKEEISTALIKAISHINTLGEEQAYQRLASLIVHRCPAEQREELITLIAQTLQHSSDREELEKMTQTTADLLFAQGIEQDERKGTIESILTLRGTQFPQVLCKH